MRSLCVCVFGFGVVPCGGALFAVCAGVFCLGRFKSCCRGAVRLRWCCARVGVLLPCGLCLGVCVALPWRCGGVRGWWLLCRWVVVVVRLEVVVSCTGLF